MEFGLREWMILIGGVLILVVVADGVRRVLADRRNVIRMGISRQSDSHDGEIVNPELPYGGARSVPRSEFDPQSSQARVDAVEAARAVTSAKPVQRPVEDRRQDSQAAATANNDKVVIKPDSVPDESAIFTDVPWVAAELPPEPRFDFEPDPAIYAEQSSDDELQQALEVGIHFDDEQAPPELECGDEAQATREPAPAAPAPKPREPAATLNAQPDEVLIINVLSRDKNGFNGADLLEVLLACDVRFGAMDIFHRFEGAQGQGQIQFSVANLVKPGTFDLDAIKEFYTPGVCMFLQLPGPKKPLEAFDCMAEIATCIVKNLQGDMRDENHSVLTAQTMEHYRQRIREYERKRLMRAAHRSA